MKLSPPSPSLERVALVLGIVSSSCLLVAAFAAFGNPREAGWSRLNELVAGARDNVRAAFTSATKVEGADCVGAVSPACSWTKDDLARLERSKHVSAASDDSTPSSSIVFDALVETSLQAEIERHDLREAASLMDEALAKDTDAASKARARLRAIQLAVALRDPAAAAEHGRRARDEIDPALAADGTSVVLLAVLAALPSVPESERAAFAEPIVRAWTEDALAFPDESPRLVVGDAGRFTLGEAHVESALRERLFAACGPIASWTQRFAELDRLRAARALRDFAGRLPMDGVSTTHWALLDAGSSFLAVHAGDSATCTGQLVDRARFAAELEQRIESAHALPAGFVLDLDGSDAAAGEPVGVPMELSPAVARAALRHPDVASVLRRAESRTAWMRAGLVVLALFVGGAALATHFALRRERRLFEARAAFVAGVSHELRTPLSSILLMAENLESGRAGANTARYHVLMRREVLRLRRLVDDVLDFSRLERGRRFEPRVEDIEPAAWFEALSEEAVALASASGVEATCSSRDLPAHAAFDGEAVRRAVLNLVANAVRHSGSARVEVEARRDGDMLVVTVADHGKGVPVRERESIFEPFARLAGSESTPGAGLGLAIVREIATAHHGSASVRDRAEGPGAVFELRVHALGDTPAITQEPETRAVIGEEPAT